MKLDDVRQVVVIGMGTMGPGLALSFAQAGFQVYGYDPDAEALAMSGRVIRSNLDALVEFGQLTSNQADTAESNITRGASLTQALQSAQVVVEAVPEDRRIKQLTYRRVSADAPGDCLLWSNTSTLNIYGLLPETLASRSIIAHWFAPPHILPLVEVVKGPQTDSKTVDLTMNLLRKMNKIPVLLERFVPGFAVNRIQRIINREVFHLLDNGYISAEDLDLAVKASLAPRMMLLGLVQRLDFTGLDLSARNLSDEEFFDPPVDNRPACLHKLIDEGNLGVKSGRGFFDYTYQPLPQILKERDRYLLQIMRGVRFCLEKNRPL